MKTTYGIQLGNYLRITKTNELIKVNGITKKKVGYLGDDKIEHYCYLPDLQEIPLTLKHLEKYKEHLDDYKQVGEEFFVIPIDSANLYRIKYLHEFQNVLGFHKIWID